MRATTKGWTSGLVGVLIFSGSLPATRIAVAALPPLFLTAARATIAAALAAALLLASRQPRPARADLLPLAITALGVVLGFPLLTAFALMHIDAARSVVFVGMLPALTAAFGALRGGERPRPAFWLFSLAGGVSVAAFAAADGSRGTVVGDGLMLAAIVACGLGYAEGATLARRLGGWQVISWALLIAAAPMTALAIATMPASLRDVGAGAWAGLAYVSVFSMLVGFVFWYRGLALGGIAGVGQLQLLQPFFGLALARLLLDEPVPPSFVVVGALVVACVACARRFATPAQPDRQRSMASRVSSATRRAAAAKSSPPPA